MKGLFVLVPVIVIPILFFLIYAGAVRVNRNNQFQRQVNEIKLDQMQAETEIELELLKWQKTASLVELERQKRRLEANLDDMHGVEAVHDSTGKLIGYMKTEATGKESTT